MQVNDYPFTTRGVTVGHIVDKAANKRYQVMDTPGMGWLVLRSTMVLCLVCSCACHSCVHVVIEFMLDVFGDLFLTNIAIVRIKFTRFVGQTQ